MQCLVQTSMIQASYWSQCPLGKMAFVHCPTYDLQRLLPFTVYKTGCRKEKDTKKNSCKHGKEVYTLKTIPTIFFCSKKSSLGQRYP